MAPSEEENLPAAHSEQLLLALAPENLPPSHGWHSGWPERLDFPGRHDEHSVDALKEK